MAERILGVTSIKLGDIAVDGGMGTTLAAIGDTVRNTAIFENTEPTTTDFFVEESDLAIESIVSDPGATTFKWSSNNCDADALVDLFGGTKVAGPPVKYEAPDTYVDSEKSIEITSKNGQKLEIVRAKIRAKFTFNFNRTALAQVDITGTILQPTKAATAPFTITYAA